MHAIRFHTAAIAIICCLSWLLVSKAEGGVGQNRMVKRAKCIRQQRADQSPPSNTNPAATRTRQYTRPPISAGNPSGYPPRSAEFTDDGVNLGVVETPTDAPSASPSSSVVLTSDSPKSTAVWKASPGGGGKKAGLGWNEQSGTQWKQFLDVPNNQFGWTYNWASSRNSDGKYPEGLNYVPMLHGNQDNHPAEWETNKKNFKDWHVTHVMSFNEPDKPKDVGGSGMPLELAVELHKKYFNAELNKEYKIVAPAYSGLEGFKSWLKACNDGCLYDVVPIHFYGKNVKELETVLNDAEKSFPGKPLWVTEIGCIAYGKETSFCTDEEVKSFMTEAVEILQARTERYSWQGSFATFDGAPDNKNNMMQPGDFKINEKGKLYATAT